MIADGGLPSKDDAQKPSAGQRVKSGSMGPIKTPFIRSVASRFNSTAERSGCVRPRRCRLHLLHPRRADEVIE